MNAAELIAAIKAKPSIPRPAVHMPRWRVREGVKTRVVPDCGYRGETLKVFEKPCCGGRIRREFLFGCNHPAILGKTVTSHVCALCAKAKGQNDATQPGS